MDNNQYVVWFVLLIAVYLLYSQKKKKKKVVAYTKIKKGKRENIKMEELAKRFIGKDCVIYLLEGGQVDGIITEVLNGVVVLTKEDKEQIINLDYVIRIREYPVNKRGKKVSIISD